MYDLYYKHPSQGWIDILDGNLKCLLPHKKFLDSIGKKTKIIRKGFY